MGSCLITGGLGFIGFNAAQHYAAQGFSVVAFDDLSRDTARKNLADLSRSKRVGIRVVRGDVRDPRALQRLMRRHGKFDLVLHLAAQVAVTTSVVNPREDFLVNALGTLNVLEAVRRFSPEAFFIYASTNKVYGGTDWVTLGKDASRYFFRAPKNGISEDAPLDFHSPYGCSKGAADQYVRDYARIYGLRSAVFRQSCIYGPWQYGCEDQGWVAWFMIAALSGKPLTVFGDGRQVRDVLHVADLLSLYDRAWRRPKSSSGQIFNAGGGPGSTLSLRELLSWLEVRLNRKIPVTHSGWRPGDQKVYVSDISKARMRLGWEPTTSIDTGLERLLAWLSPRFSAS